MDKSTAQADYPSWVDVRDVAKAHVQDLVIKEAEGKRFILTSTSLWYSDVSILFPLIHKEMDRQRTTDCGYCEEEFSGAESLYGKTGGKFYLTVVLTKWLVISDPLSRLSIGLLVLRNARF